MRNKRLIGTKQIDTDISYFRKLLHNFINNNKIYLMEVYRNLSGTIIIFVHLMKHFECVYADQRCEYEKKICSLVRKKVERIYIRKQRQTDFFL